METIHVIFDEMHQSMDHVRMSSGPEPIIMTLGQLKSGLAPTDKELEILFQPILMNTLNNLESMNQYFCYLQLTLKEPSLDESPIIRCSTSLKLTMGYWRTWFDTISSSGIKTLASGCFCGGCFHTELPKSEPKNFKMAVIEDASFSHAKLKFTYLIDLKYGEISILAQYMLQRHVTIQLMQMQIHLRGCQDSKNVKIQEEVRREVLSFLEIDWLAGHQRSKEAHQYLQQRLNTLPCLDVVLKSFGCDHSSKTTDLTSIKFLYTMITKVQLLFVVTMSSTLDQSTLTYVTISFESKWKIEWLNSTSWKQTINL
ncbi:hypothetical protein Tco_0060773 [Tanacetum coccineum]